MDGGRKRTTSCFPDFSANQSKAATGGLKQTHTCSATEKKHASMEKPNIREAAVLTGGTDGATAAVCQ